LRGVPSKWRKRVLDLQKEGVEDMVEATEVDMEEDIKEEGMVTK